MTLRKRISTPAAARWTRYAVIAACLTTPALAYTYDLPGDDFEAGTPISAQAVNARFHALLDAANEQQAVSAQLEDQIGQPTEHISTHWPDRALAWSQGNGLDAAPCTRWINGRPGCIVAGYSSAPSVVVPLDGVRQGNLVEWGMHIGTSNGTGVATGWTCELRFNEETLSTISFSDNTPGQWSRFVNAEGLDVPVDMVLDGVALGTGFRAGWDVWCDSDGPNGRFDIHQIYVRTRQDGAS